MPHINYSNFFFFSKESYSNFYMKSFMNIGYSSCSAVSYREWAHRWIPFCSLQAAVGVVRWDLQTVCQQVREEICQNTLQKRKLPRYMEVKGQWMRCAISIWKATKIFLLRDWIKGVELAQVVCWYVIVTTCYFSSSLCLDSGTPQGFIAPVYKEPKV